MICHIRVCCYHDQARDFQLPRSYLVKHIYIERTPGIANGASLNFEDELSCVNGKLVRLLIGNLFRLHAPRGGSGGYSTTKFTELNLQ